MMVIIIEIEPLVEEEAMSATTVSVYDIDFFCTRKLSIYRSNSNGRSSFEST